jgi:hypothetical protein
MSRRWEQEVPVQRRLSIGLLATLVTALPAAAVVLGQADDFESGTTDNWTIGQALPSSPQNVATGGPDGVDDNYLLVTGLGGFGGGSRLVAFNIDQWSGDYVTAGVGSLLVDVNNFSASPLSLRLLIADGVGQFFANGAISADAVLVPANSGWTTVVFPIAPTDLIALQGDATTALSNAVILWIEHNEGATHPPAAFAATLGVDNIEAMPEPAAATALAVGCALLALLERRRARRS